MLLNYCRMVFTIVPCLLLTNALYAQNWQTKGNTNLSNDSFLGTTDEVPLSIRTKNKERIFIGTDGRIFSNGWWGLNAEPDQNYQLTVGGNIWAEKLTASIIDAPANKSLQFHQNGLTRLIFSNGQAYSDNKNWWGLGVYPSQLYRLSVGGDIKADNIYLSNAHAEVINATAGKDLVFKAANKEYIRLFKGGQGIAISSFVGIGEQPDGVNQLYVNGNTYSKSIKTNDIIVNSTLKLQNEKSTFSVYDGRIMLKKWVGINTEPEQDYSLSIVGNTHLMNALHIGDIPLNKANDFKLAIDGKAICEEVKVQLKKDWPDYVFNSSYNLMPLDEVEKFIAQHKHLPGIPSSQEIQKQQGIEIGNMQVLLLQKIEELTLHVIELKKENEMLKKKIR